MKLDDVINSLQTARNKLGGQTELRIHLACNGNGDFVDIIEISNSQVFGLSIEVSPPWWTF